MDLIVKIPNGSYIDCRLDGLYAAIQGPQVVTATANYQHPEGILPLFLRVNDSGPLKFAGQASTMFEGVIEWSNDHWTPFNGSVTPNGVIYDLNGTLHRWHGGPNMSSQGYRYVAPDGRLVMGDETIFANGVNEFTDLSSAQDRSILIGQGNIGGGIQVWINNQLRQVVPGSCRAIHARRGGDEVVFCYYD